MDSSRTPTSRRGKGKEKSKNGQEEMKNQLKEAGLYDEGMSEDDMKGVLKVLNDSMQLARKNTEHSSPSELYKVPLSPASYTHNDKHLSSSSPNQTANNEPVAQDSSSYSNRYLTKTPPDEDQTRDNKDDSPMYSRYNISPSPDRKILSHRKPTQQTSYSSVLLNKFADWRIDPLDCKKLEHDVPLSRTKRANPPPKFQMLNKVPIIPEEMRDKQRAVLEKVAKLLKIHTQKPGDEEVTWGTPIKVGIANGSLDRHPIVEKDDPQEVPESFDALRLAEFGLRTRNTIRNPYLISDDEEDEEIFQKKRKKATGAVHRPSWRRNGTIMRNNQNEDNADRIDHQSTLDDYDYRNNIENVNRRAKSPTPDYPEPCYRKNKILPSRKSNFYDVLVEVHEDAEKSSNITRSNSVEYEPVGPAKPAKMNESLNDAEIEAQLITDDEEEELVIPRSPEARFSKRLKLGSSLLQSNCQKEENEKRKVAEEKRVAAEKEAQERRERVNQRMAECVRRHKQRESDEKKQKEKEERYRSNLSRSQNWSRVELESDELPKDEVAWDANRRASETAHVLPVAHNKSDKEDEEPEGVDCPICGNNFPQDKVEAHAGSCEAFVDDGQNNDNQTNDVFVCEMCEYNTNDKKTYERHVTNECEGLINEEDKRNRRTSKTIGTKTPTSATKPQTKKRKR